MSEFVGFSGILQDPYLEFARQSKVLIRKYMVQVVIGLFEQEECGVKNKSTEIF